MHVQNPLAMVVAVSSVSVLAVGMYDLRVGEVEVREEENRLGEIDSWEGEEDAWRRRVLDRGR